MNIVITLLALLIEAAVGYPNWIARAIGHPVMWVGYMIDWLDRKLNHPERSAGYGRAVGIVALICIVVVPAIVGLAVQHGLARLPFGFAIAGILGSALLAQRSLHDHVARVADALEHDGLPAARHAVSQIVGRDPDTLDTAGVARAAIESLAENFSDGVVAPAFWFAVGGLGGAAAYKAVNTADSMIGHRTPRHRHFGYAAARLDDLVNLPASRLSALLLVAAAALQSPAAAAEAWRAVWRDARHHRSPNAGWPEAAMAGALGIALAGPRVYGGTKVDGTFMGTGRRDLRANDIHAALALYRRADMMLIVLVALLAAAVIWPG